MAHGYHQLAGELDAADTDPNRSQTTICLPSPSPAKRVSTYYPKKGPQALEDSNPDPFYLEHSLTDTTSLYSCSTDLRDVRCSEDGTDHYLSSILSPENTVIPMHSARKAVHRSTLSRLEFEHNIHFHPPSLLHLPERPLLQQYSQDSFSSAQSDATTPDLTPSSSFSSTYSAPLCPEKVLKATEQLSLHAAYAQKGAAAVGNAPRFPPPATPPAHLRSASCTVPSSPLRAITPIVSTRHQSSEMLMMNPGTNAMSSSSNRTKPLPSLPPVLARSATVQVKKIQTHSARSHIEPSMISPPSLINPVTLEPHTSHFDQAFFIPANEVPSPVPSPVANSSPLTRQATDASIKDRPPSSTTTDPHCEQSVWESDSETESIGPKSRSRKPIDTLRKVRSKVQLRVAKSATKLNTPIQDESPMEKFPTIHDVESQEMLRDEVRMVIYPRPGSEVSRPSTQQTLRLVAPSTTSLVRPRSRNGSTQSDFNVARTTAAAMHARSRRQKRSNTLDATTTITPALDPPPPILCRDKRTDLALHHHPISHPDRRVSVLKRFWGSLRVLSCH
ncbi:hypothetical protein ASPZODRAFT_39150, partial [Penicilliopsis zonata CBS 506.65]